ncbi:phosphopantetheine-binding protein [Nocardia sp. CDC159]|uniref:Phosphopantetheine-binding protein n=1 Tax=Nocardia pulmonis TaxID=2951408 RepID=A0A9X2IYF8_9NOCA|nr:MULTISPECIES: phosphopantetheine-binding protein [Nocardia]MCM6775614.1 phosphopantetheine-binding protein [Nocardia pulmonis]MCM6787652.1 phosphopantetheine-binding protein [Nocardia sp. CDC159]
MLRSDELTDIVRQAIALALAVDLDEVTPDKLLIPELGAESIDFLDITFRLEQFLPISIPRDDLNEQAEDVFGAGAAVDTLRRLTPLGAFLVRERLYGVDPAKVEIGMRVEDVSSLWTVRTWVGLCQRLLDTVPQQCPACAGPRTFVRNDEGEYHAACGNCHAELAAVPGDELNQRWFEEIRDTDEVAALLEASRKQAAEAEAATTQTPVAAE